MKIEDLEVYEGVCSFCYPDHDEKLSEKTKHLLKKGGHWIGGYSKEKYEEWQKIKDQFEIDLKKKCLCISPDYGKFICAKHLIELVSKML
jgi:hypothetical protein